MFRGILIVFGLILLFLFSFCPEATADSPIIRKIVIIRDNVFDDSLPESRKFPFKLANRFHILTREKVIRRELLFREGEVLDYHKVEETERNLRKLEYLTNVVIQPVSQPDSVDLYVKTQDLWTLSPSVAVSGGGGKNRFFAGIDDENFLGLGQTIALSYLQDNRDFFKEETGFLFWDPALFPPRVGLVVALNKLSYGHLRYLKLGRPLYSLSTPWGAGLVLSDFKDRTGFYQDGKEIIRNRFTSQRIKAEFVLAKGEYRRREISLTYDYRYDRYRPVAYRLGLDTARFPLAEESEKLGWMTAYYELSLVRYHKAKNFDRYTRTEDINTGWSGEIGLGRAAELLGSAEESWFAESKIRLAKKLSSAQYASFAGNWSGFWRGGNFIRVETKYKMVYYNQHLPHQTLVFGWRGFDYTRQLRYRQFILGGADGLRGYAANRFSGTKAVILNLEERFFSNLQILTFGIGGAIFVDGGYAWNKTKEINLPQDIHWDYGIGLRLGPTKAFANRVIRLDLAKSFSSDDYFISFGLGQVIEWD